MRPAGRDKEWDDLGSRPPPQSHRPDEALAKVEVKLSALPRRLCVSAVSSGVEIKNRRDAETPGKTREFCKRP